MANPNKYFSDMFTGRIVEDIQQITDDEGKTAVQITFLGTPRKLSFYSATRENGLLPAIVWIDADKTHLAYNF